MSAPQTTSVPAKGNAFDNLCAGAHVLCDGAMGTMLFDRGDFGGRCCDELNISQPDRVASVHLRYLQAGARIIETNTFGGNSFRLETHGLRDRVHEINLAGVRIARQCVKQAATNALVAGAVGPLGVRLGPHGEINLVKARAAFAEQISALAEGGPGAGVDLIMIETMTTLAEAAEAISAAKELAPRLRMVVMMTVNQSGDCLDGTPVELAAARLTDLGADAIGCNCSYGPELVLSVVQRMRTVTDLPLVAMPNAGLPCSVDGRSVYPVSPEDVAGFTRRFLQAGATLIGGCCGTTPAHTQAMKVVLEDIEAEFASWGGQPTGR